MQQNHARRKARRLHRCQRMPVKNPPGTLRIALLILGAFAFLCFEWNLHCTQNTSFFTAVFEMEVHPEDKGFGDSAPLVYRPGFAWPLRAVLAAALLVALFGPARAVIGRRLGSLSSSAATLTTFLSPMVALAVFLLLPTEVIGERFHALSLAAAIWATVLALIAASALRSLSQATSRSGTTKESR
jgi:hypothetical protein